MNAKELKADWMQRIQKIGELIRSDKYQLVIASRMDVSAGFLEYGACLSGGALPPAVITPACNDVEGVYPSSGDRLRLAVPILGWVFLPKSLDLDPFLAALQERGVNARVCGECPGVFLVVEDDEVEAASMLHDCCFAGGAMEVFYKNAN